MSVFVRIRGAANLKGTILLSVNSISINLIKTKQNTPISLELIFLEQVNTTGKPCVSRNLKKAWAWVSGHEEEHLEHLKKHLKGRLLPFYPQGRAAIPQKQLKLPLRATRWPVEDSVV